MASVLEFLQNKFSNGLSPSTLKVYMVTLAAFRPPLDGNSLGKHHLITHFLCGTMRMRPLAQVIIPVWDLIVVLEGLSLAPFGPLDSAPDKCLALKMVFLLAITSLKGVGNFQPLSVAPSCVEFSPGRVKAILYPRPDYVPKVSTDVAQPVFLQVFHPHHVSGEQKKLRLLSPVRALKTYVRKTSQWRTSD